MLCETNSLSSGGSPARNFAAVAKGRPCAAPSPSVVEPFRFKASVRKPPTDAVLVARARTGDAAAMRELLGRYEGRLFSLAMRIVQNEHDAQEVLQDVSFAVWQKLPHFEGRSQISTWLHRVTVNAALMHLRSRRRNLRILTAAGDVTRDRCSDGFDGFESLRAASPTPEDHLQFVDLRGEIRKAVSGLPQELRAVLLARLVEGRNTRQTANSLGLSTIAVKMRLHRARTVLRETIESHSC